MPSSFDQSALDLVGLLDADLDALRIRVLNEQEARRTLASSQAILDQLAQHTATARDRGTKGAQPWAPGLLCPVGYQATYGGKTYTCRQTHTTQADWTPDKTPALWTVVATSSAWTAGAAYKTGDQVTYQSKTYTCVQANTAQAGWEPPNVPALWKAA